MSEVVKNLGVPVSYCFVQIRNSYGYRWGWNLSSLDKRFQLVFWLDYYPKYHRSVPWCDIDHAVMGGFPSSLTTGTLRSRRHISIVTCLTCNLKVINALWVFFKDLKRYKALMVVCFLWVRLDNDVRSDILRINVYMYRRISNGRGSSLDNQGFS